MQHGNEKLLFFYQEALRREVVKAAGNVKDLRKAIFRHDFTGGGAAYAAFTIDDIYG